jgi:PAS domain S-box-containing protein
MLQDVVEQLTLELSQSKRLFEQIFDNIDVAIWSLDTQTNLATMSAGYTKLFGLTKERLASNPDAWKQMIYTEDLELTNHHIELVHAGQATTYDHRIVLASGEIYAHLYSTAITK